MPSPMPAVLASDSIEQPLTQKIAKQIRSQNMIGFDAYQSACLYDPEHGYYTQARNTFDRAGDFITAPAYSKLFGYCIARFCAQYFETDPRFSDPNHRVILELGPGTGQLAQHILEYFSNQNILITHYYLLDRAPREIDLFSDKLTWIPKIPENFTGIILANEVLDAIPSKRWCLEKNIFYELGVSLDQDLKFCWAKKSLLPDSPLQIALSQLANRINFSDYPDLYCSEINLNLEFFLKQITDPVKTGVFLFLDYGYPEPSYYHANRSHGTLCGYFRHQLQLDQDCLKQPGLIDLSTHVNFCQVQRMMNQLGLNFIRYQNQAHFLIQHDLLELAQRETDQVHSHIWPLINPNQMGELIKALIFDK